VLRRQRAVSFEEEVNVDNNVNGENNNNNNINNIGEDNNNEGQQYLTDESNWVKSYWYRIFPTYLSIKSEEILWITRSDSNNNKQ
jgi:hypothetical protein